MKQREKSAEEANPHANAISVRDCCRRVAQVFHLTTVGCITAAGVVLDVGLLYYLGTAAFLGLIIYEHRLVSPQDISRANVAFFNMNGIISVVFFLFVMTDVLVR